MATNKKFRIVEGPNKFDLMTALFHRSNGSGVTLREFHLIVEGGERRYCPATMHHDPAYQKHRGAFTLAAFVDGIETSSRSGHDWILTLLIPRTCNFVEMWEFYPELFPSTDDELLCVRGVTFSTVNRRGVLEIGHNAETVPNRYGYRTK
jgi:hypothetical protein